MTMTDQETNSHGHGTPEQDTGGRWLQEEDRPKLLSSSSGLQPRLANGKNKVVRQETRALHDEEEAQSG
ncbi:hypothetical protein E4U41_006473 [Claviceps citrina]|nr:hypothetical protein E4U41_006473 [Claviceps citrina]